MIRTMILVAVFLLLMPGWAGIDRLATLPENAQVAARVYAPVGGWPARIGRLSPIGAIELSSPSAAFGGFSALAVSDSGVTLLSDGGNYVRFRIARRRLTHIVTGALRDGPGNGWAKEDRDSESLTVDPVSGRMWVGFERANEIWRYSADFRHGERHIALQAMRRWWANSGAESLVRLPDGRFLVIAERWRGAVRPAVLFNGDPTAAGASVARVGYRPPAGYDPSDAAALPNGDLVVLNRRHLGWLRFATSIVIVPSASIRVGAMVQGLEIAKLAPPIIYGNCEGLAITQEHGATMLWIVTDNDLMPGRKTLLMKFRLH